MNELKPQREMDYLRCLGFLICCPPFSQRGTTFVPACLHPGRTKPFLLTSVEQGDKTENDRVAVPESISVYLKSN